MDPFNPKEGEPAFGGMDDLQSDLLASPDLTRLLEKVNEGTDMVAADDRKLKKAERDRVRVRYHNDPDLKYPDSPASRQKRMHNSGVAFAQDIKRGSERFLAHHQQVFDQTQSPLVRSAKWLEEARTAFDDAQVAEREAGDEHLRTQALNPDPDLQSGEYYERQQSAASILKEAKEKAAELKSRLEKAQARRKMAEKDALERLGLAAEEDELSGRSKRCTATQLDHI
jgi:hypothetical protein